jgi:transposase
MSGGRLEARMRGEVNKQAAIMLALTPDQLVPRDHPIRKIKPIVDRALAELSPLFESIYARIGRPSIPPEHLLKAQLLMVLFSVPSARRFCDQLPYNMLFKWFLDLNVDDRPFNASSFSKNQERLLSADVARRFLLKVVAQARRRHLLSEEHFSVDGTLLESWASLKSFRPIDKDGDQPPSHPGSGGFKDPEVDYRGEKRSNATHRSTTDPEARLARKGLNQAKLCYLGHALMENRNGLVIDIELTQAAGVTEWQTALDMLDRSSFRARRITLGADRNYDNRGFVSGCRARGATPHVVQYPTTPRRHSAIDQRTTRHPGYGLSLKLRKRIEEVFGWWKTVGGGHKLRYIGVRRNRSYAEMCAAAYNLVRMANLERAACPA